MILNKFALGSAHISVADLRRRVRSYIRSFSVVRKLCVATESCRTGIRAEVNLHKRDSVSTSETLPTLSTFSDRGNTNV